MATLSFFGKRFALFVFVCVSLVWWKWFHRQCDHVSSSFPTQSGSLLACLCFLDLLLTVNLHLNSSGKLFLLFNYENLYIHLSKKVKDLHIISINYLPLYIKLLFYCFFIFSNVTKSSMISRFIRLKLWCVHKVSCFWIFHIFCGV